MYTLAHSVHGEVLIRVPPRAPHGFWRDAVIEAFTSALYNMSRPSHVLGGTLTLFETETGTIIAEGVVR